MIDFSTPEGQAILAQAAEQHAVPARDLAGWCQVASLDDARAILAARALADAPVDVGSFDRFMSAVTLVGQLANAAMPVLGLAPAIKNFIEAL